MRSVAILLAAGESTRAGSPKPLLPWFGATLVERQVEALLRAGVSDVFVVTGHRAEEVGAHLRDPRVHAVPNPRYREGKATSIKAGLAALPPDAGTIVILAVDQPRPMWIIRRMLEAHAAKKALLSVPSYERRGGHPLVVDRSLMGELEAISDEEQGIRKVLRAHAPEINWVEFNTPLVRLDVNTPEAFRKAMRFFPDPRMEESQTQAGGRK